MCWVPGALETPSSCPKGLGLGALRRLQSQGFSPQSGGLWADGWPVRTHRSALSCGPVVLAAGLGVLNPQPLGDSHTHVHTRVHTHIYTHPTEQGKPRERALGRMDEKLVPYCQGIRMAPPCPGPWKSPHASFVASKCHVFAGDGKLREARV